MTSDFSVDICILNSVTTLLNVCVGFMVNKVALGQVFLGLLRFTISVLFHRGCHISSRDGQYTRYWPLLRDVVIYLL
jgi:hypothetical protein